jgi:hypothetical protein
MGSHRCSHTQRHAIEQNNAHSQEENELGDEKLYITRQIPFPRDKANEVRPEEAKRRDMPDLCVESQTGVSGSTSAKNSHSRARALRTIADKPLLPPWAPLVLIRCFT